MAKDERVTLSISAMSLWGHGRTGNVCSRFWLEIATKMAAPDASPSPRRPATSFSGSRQPYGGPEIPVAIPTYRD
jgi:hypothetical protein